MRRTGVSGAIQGPGGVVQYQQPLTAQLLKGNSYSADVFFHGIEASTQIQSYPSNYQLAATGVEVRRHGSTTFTISTRHPEPGQSK